jgi:hypothetical protein
MDDYNHVNLYNTQISMEVLINNIYLFNLVDILKTQELTEEFIVNYILNPNYQLKEEEKSITMLDVLKYQKKINVNKFMRLYIIGPIDQIKPNFEDYV